MIEKDKCLIFFLNVERIHSPLQCKKPEVISSSQSLSMNVFSSSSAIFVLYKYTAHKFWKNNGYLCEDYERAVCFGTVRFFSYERRKTGVCFDTTHDLVLIFVFKPIQIKELNSSFSEELVNFFYGANYHKKA